MEDSSSLLGTLATLFRCALFPPISDACHLSDHARRVLLRDLASREFNAFLWVSLIAVTALLFSKLIKLLWLWREADRIGGPPCISFYGHCDLLSRKSLAEVLSDSHNKYGSVVKLWLGATQLLVSIKDPKIIKDMLSKAKDKIPSTGKAFYLVCGRSSLFVSSFSEEQKLGEAIRTDLSERLLERANVIPAKFLVAMERIDMSMAKGSVNCKRVSQHLAFTILGTTLFGDAFFTWPKANVYEELLMRITNEACFWASYNITPFWKRGFRRYQCMCTELKCLTQDIIQQSRKSANPLLCVDQNLSSESKTAEKPFVEGASCFSKMQDQFFVQELKGHIGEMEDKVFGDIMGMMFHGCLTTSGLIHNILMRLVRDPKIQDEVYAEISKAQKDSTMPVDQSIYKMPLLLATVYEASRLFPDGPLLQRCSLDSELNLENGVAVPAGTVVVVPVQLVHEDYSIWGSDACKFNPYRFLLQSSKTPDSVLKAPLSGEAEDPKANTFVVNEAKDDAAFLTFGSGFRSCVGQKFVIKAVAAQFAELLRSYEIKLLAINDENPKMNNYKFEPISELVFLKRVN